MIHFSQKILFKKTPSLFSPFSFPASRNFFSSEEQKDLEDPSLQNENADSTVESPPPLETRKKRKKRKDKDPTPEELAESFNITTITAKDLEEELIYSIQQDSDTEYGSVPIFHELVEKEPSEKEILEGTKNRKSHSLYFPSDDQHNKFSYQKMLLYKIAEHIYTNESSIFYQKYMRRDIKTQMKMFPHTPEEQSFNLPFGFEDQIKYTKELLEKNKIYLEETVAFRMPDIGIEDEAENEETNELNKIKTYKSILGKEIYRLMKELEHNEKSKNCDKFTSNILDNVVNAFNDGTYDIISPRDFRFLITKKEFLQYSHVFFNQKFFQQNPNIIGDIDFEEILKNCIHDISFVKNLEFARFHRRFFNSSYFPAFRNKTSYYQVISLLGDTNEMNFNYLSFFYHSVRIIEINESFLNKLNLSQWNRAFTRIYWGVSSRKDHKESFKTELHELFFLKYQISLNEKLTLFLIDLFLNSKKYEKAQSAFAIIIMILSRLESNIENMSYLYQTFISSFSLENFNFYIRKSLGDVLKTFSNRIFYQNFLLSLSNYDNMLQNKNSEDFKPLPQNIFELSFYAKDQKTQSPTFISIGYNFQYENLTNNLLLNPWNADIHALKIENSLKGSIDEYLPSISENSPHKIAYNFFINKNYQLLLDNIKSDFYLIMNDMPNLPGLNDEDIGEASFLEEKKKFVDLFLKNPVSLDFKDNKKVMAFIYDFLKPHREKLASLINKTSFDRRLERFALHANEELKKFAEARENWVYGVVNEQMIKKGEVKKGFHWIRKWGRLYAIRVDKNGKITPAMISKQVMLKTLYPKVNRWVHRRKKKKTRKITKGFKGKTFKKSNRPPKKQLQARAQATFTSMKQFSTNENENDDYDMEVQKDEMESGFKAYLQKLKEIEDRKNKEDEDLMAKGLLSKQDLEKMKKSLFKDDSLYRSAFKEESIFMNPKSIVKTKEEKILKKSIPEKFEKIDQKTRQKSVIQAYPSNLSAIPNIDFWNERFQDKEFEINDLLKLVERSLQENEGTKKLLLTSLAYSKNGETEGSIVIELLMGGRKIKLEPVPQLIVNFVSHLGSISINYNNYLKKTNLDYDLPQQVYIKILNLHLSNINYNRKAFKRILAHLIRYNKSIPHETILACLEVFKKHKLGMTMLEFIHLILRNKIIINKESLKCFFDHLKDYKIISDDIDDLFKAFLKEYEWQYESSFLSGYLDVLIKQKKTDDFMKLFEKIKDFLMIRKIKTEEKQQEISNEEKPQILENIPVEINKEDSKKVQIIKKNEHIEAHNFYIDFVEKLNQHEVLKFSKLVFYDFINNKFTLTQKDFLVGLKTFNDSGEEFLVLYKQYKESPLFQFDEKLFTLLIEAINQSPTELSPVFDEILSEYIYTKKFALTTQNLNFFISAFGRTQRFFEFTSFLRFLARNKHELNRNTKLACYKVLGRVTDDMSKPYIKGLVDTIFDQNIFEKEDKERMNKMKKRNEDKKYKKITKGKFEDFKQIDQQQSTGSDSVTNQPTEREFFSPISSPTHEEIEKEPKKVEINQKIESVVKDSKKKQDTPAPDKENKETIAKKEITQDDLISEKRKNKDKNLLDRMNDETADKTQKRRSSRLQAFATWGRINGSMNLEEEIKK